MIPATALPTASTRASHRVVPLALSPTASRWNRRPLPFWARASLALEVLGAYLAVRWGISRTALPSLVRALRSRRPRADHLDVAGAFQHELSLRLGFAVQALLPRPGDGPCLIRSLVLVKLLARRRIPARLVIGVRSEPSFSAHAWVEHCGQPLLPTDAAHIRLVEL